MDAGTRVCMWWTGTWEWGFWVIKFVSDRYCQTVFQGGGTSFYPPQSCVSALVAPRPHQRWHGPFFSTFSILLGAKWHLIVIVILTVTSLIAVMSDTLTYVYCFVKHLFNSLSYLYPVVKLPSLWVCGRSLFRSGVLRQI